MIVDRPITVSYYQPEAIELEKAPEKEALVTSVKTESEIENKPFLPPASERVQHNGNCKMMYLTISSFSRTLLLSRLY